MVTNVCMQLYNVYLVVIIKIQLLKQDPLYGKLPVSAVVIFCSTFWVSLCPLLRLLNFRPYVIPHCQHVEIFYDF